MKKYEKSLVSKWEFSFIELRNCVKRIFKVTRRIPELNVSETKLFKIKKKAIKQFKDWLN